MSWTVYFGIMLMPLTFFWLPLVSFVLQVILISSRQSLVIIKQVILPVLLIYRRDFFSPSNFRIVWKLQQLSILQFWILFPSAVHSSGKFWFRYLIQQAFYYESLVFWNYPSRYGSTHALHDFSVAVKKLKV